MNAIVFDNYYTLVPFLNDWIQFGIKPLHKMKCTVQIGHTPDLRYRKLVPDRQTLTGLDRGALRLQDRGPSVELPVDRRRSPDPSAVGPSMCRGLRLHHDDYQPARAPRSPPAVTVTVPQPNTTVTAGVSRPRPGRPSRTVQVVDASESACPLCFSPPAVKSGISVRVFYCLPAGGGPKAWAIRQPAGRRSTVMGTKFII